MTCLKQQTVEREKTRRRKRVGIGGEGYDPMNPNDPGGSDDDKVNMYIIFARFFWYTFCFENYSDLLCSLGFLHIRGRSLRTCNKFAQ